MTKRWTMVAVAALSLTAFAGDAHAGRGNGNGNGNQGSSDPVTLEVYYCWGLQAVDPLCPIVHFELEPDGTASSGPYTGTWRTFRGGKRIEIRWDTSPHATYVGEDDGGCWVGEMSADTGLVGVWEGCPLP